MEGNFSLIISGDSSSELLSITIISKDNNIGLLGCGILNEDLTPQTSIFGSGSLLSYFVNSNPLLNKFVNTKESFDLTKSQFVAGVSGAFMWFRKEVFKKVKPFDPDIFMYDLPNFTLFQQMGSTTPTITIVRVTMKQTIFCIAGMHRSGSSLFANWLHESGIFIGYELYGAESSNQRGHYEDMEFLNLHKKDLHLKNLDISGLFPGPYPLKIDRNKWYYTRNPLKRAYWWFDIDMRPAKWQKVFTKTCQQYYLHCEQFGKKFPQDILYINLDDFINDTHAVAKKLRLFLNTDLKFADLQTVFDPNLLTK